MQGYLTAGSELEIDLGAAGRRGPQVFKGLLPGHELYCNLLGLIVFVPPTIRLSPTSRLILEAMPEYTSLHDPAPHIRLLRVHAAQEDGVVNATMDSFARASAPPYAAISYTCGPEFPIVPIYVNGTETFVRHNCRYALWQSYFHNSQLWIWIDSVCINQHDLVEKNNQVGMMGEIYRSAQFVFASIGAQEHDSAYSCAAIANFELNSAGPHWDVVEAGKPRPWQLMRLPRYWMPAGAVLPFQWSTYLRRKWNLARLRASAEHLIQRPYWTRLWILQELSVAQLVFVLCGPDIILYDSIVAFFETLNYSPTDNYSLDHDFFYTVLTFGYKPQSSLDFERQLLQSIYPTGKRKITDLQLFNRLSKLQCEDVRDRIFGTLSLVEWDDGEGAVLPNYSLESKTIAQEILSLFCRQARKERTNRDSLRNCISLAQALAELLELTYEDLTTYSDGLLYPEEPVAASLSYGHRLASTEHDVEIRSPMVKTHFSLPNFCELISTSEQFSFSMDETYGVFQTQPLTIFEDFVRKELSISPDKPRFHKLIIEGKLVGLLSRHVEPGDVLKTIDRGGTKNTQHEIDLCLLFRPIEQKKRYAIVGHAIVGKGLPPLYYPYKSENAMAFSRQGTFHLQANDIMAQAAREGTLHRTLRLDAHGALVAYMTTNFTTASQPSFFESLPGQERWLRR